MKLELKQKSEFKHILESYQPSKKALEAIHDLHLVILAGTTSAGRNTIIDRLVAGGGYEYFISDTTRPPRINHGVLEENGGPYWFVSEEQMLQQLQNGEMMEAAVIHDQQVSGTSIREFERIMHKNKIAISEIEPQGVETYVSLRPHTIPIFVAPPSFDEWIKRIKKRGIVSGEDLNNRLKSAVSELECALNKSYYHIVINDHVERATEEIDSIARNGPQPERSKEKLAVLQGLLTETRQKLNEL